MALYNRRHALRFGRLYIYLRGGKIQKLSDLQDAFQWNQHFSSSFSDINPNDIPKSAIAAFLALPPDVLKEFLKVVASHKDSQSEAGHEKKD